MYMNFDKMYLNKYFVSAFLGFDGLIEKGFMLVKENVNMEFDALLERIKSFLGVGFLVCVKSFLIVKDLVFVCGLGVFMFSFLKA